MPKLKDGHYFDCVGDEVWIKTGEHHNNKGPALIYPNGDKEFWLYDIPYPQIKNDVLWRIEVQRLKRQKED